MPASYRQAKEIQIQRVINSDRFIVDGEHAGMRASSIEFLLGLQTLMSLLAKKDRQAMD
ncbi:hypothetical protein [Paenibacillus sp. FSL H7-0714]|uniref:hypothetical protein n=1 Tax=Paenibacillus sp. FSL H7-0714 TaxID=2954735 RepID=UPI0030F66292